MNEWMDGWMDTGRERWIDKDSLKRILDFNRAQSLRKCRIRLGTVAQTCNPSYLEGGDQDCGLRPAPAKSSQGPHPKQGLGVVLCI
jgi:hypothetical protein